MKKVYKTITALLLVCILVIPGSLTANAATVAIVTDYSSLKTAIENKTDTIVVANDITLNDVININHDVTLISLGATIYPASGKRHFNVFRGDVSDITVTFQDVILDGKKIGGGLFTYSTNATINNAVIQNCYYVSGGAIYSTGHLTLAGCTIKNNTSNNGGGINSSGDITISDCIFTNNSVGSGRGGAIYATSATSILRCTFTNNDAYSGGALHFTSLSSTRIESTTISNNWAYSGGGIYSMGELSLILADITNNSAQFNGGGVFHDSANTLYNIYSNISNNSPNNIAYK